MIHIQTWMNVTWVQLYVLTIPTARTQAVPTTVHVQINIKKSGMETK